MIFVIYIFHRAGFVLEKKPLTETTNKHLKQYRQGYGFPFVCLRIFREWCCVTPKKRAAWSETKEFSNDILETVCDFLTDLMKMLYLDMATKMTSFRKDATVAEKTVVRLFLQVFPEGLAVFSGSNNVGYYRLSDEQVMKPSDMMNFVTSPKFVLFLKLKARCTSTKLEVPSARKNSMYLTEDLVTEYVKKKDNDNIKQKIEKLFNKIRIYEVRNICPAILNKISSNPEKIQEVRSEIKMKSSTSVTYLDFIADDVKQVLTAHTSLDNTNEDLILNEMKKLIEEEKTAMINELTYFEYPKKGSGMMLEILNDGMIDRVLQNEQQNTDEFALFIYVCCAVPDDLRIKEHLDEYGKVVQLMTEKDATIATWATRLWGKIKCHTKVEPQTLLKKITERRSWAALKISRHVNLTWARPNLRADATSVDFLRVTVREIATEVDQVFIHRNADSWTPSQKYVVIGKDPCKIWWLGNGDGTFKVNHKYVSNQKITRAVKESFGNDVRVEIDRKTKGAKHLCFQREKCIFDNFVKTVPNETTRFHITLNEPDKDFVFHTDFIDFFENGKEFLKEYEQARVNKLWSVKPKKQMWVHKVEHYSVVLVKPEVFECVKEGLDVVRETIRKNLLHVSVDVSPTKSNMMLIQIHGQSEGDVKRVSNVVKKAISPDILKPVDAKCASASYILPFLSPYGGKKLTAKIEDLFSVRYLPHPNGDELYIYGSPQCKKVARQRILTHIDNLPEPVHIAAPSDELKLSLLKHVMNSYGSDLKGLCRQTGVESLFWNSKLGHFTVWGSSNCVQACRRKIMDAYDLVVSLVPPERHHLTCVACLCPVQGLPFTLTLCGHVYCEQCINLHVSVAVREKSLPISCIAEGCKEVIVLKDIGRSCHYSREGLSLLLDSAVSLFIAQGGESCPVRHCPTPNCPGIFFVSEVKYRGQEINCGTCSASICNHCLTSPYHQGYTCALWKSREHMDQNTAQWFSENENLRKMCPGCGIGIEMIDGCFNVYCTNCKTSICFKCMVHFDDSTSCYSHLTDVHGGYD